ncbi:MAG: HU family DNA-binding protein [Pseudomonadales bacterium]|nr:HU family DNA-binding protein [Pseudomonadales bacterium]
MAATKTTGGKAPAKKAPAAKKPAARVTATKKPAAKAAAKPAARKAAPAKAPAAKAPAKAPAAKAPVRKVTAVSEKMSKATMLNEIVGATGLARKDVASVMTELEVIIERHLKKRAVGEFALPGLLKIKTVKKPAQRAKKGVPNPFKPGETMDVAAKPASVRVRITPLKKLKDMAQ